MSPKIIVLLILPLIGSINTAQNEVLDNNDIPHMTVVNKILIFYEQNVFTIHRN